jgi:hypothetical protein
VTPGLNPPVPVSVARAHLDHGTTRALDRQQGLWTRGDAISHWILYGLREGRRGCSKFWSPSCLAKHADVKNYARTNGNVDHCKAVFHYLTWGFKEEREL